jgi:hypothetical protein
VFKPRVHRDQEGSERLVRELLASGGTRSPATVLSVRQGMVVQNTFKGPHKFSNCEVRVLVEPSNGAQFETTFSQVFEALLLPVLRTTPAAFNVIYDAADQSRIALDVITYREELKRELTPQLNQIKSLAAEFEQSGGNKGHQARLQGMAANPPAAPPPPTPDPLAELERLGQLRASGALSEEQFAEAKAELLRRL